MAATLIYCAVHDWRGITPCPECRVTRPVVGEDVPNYGGLAAAVAREQAAGAATPSPVSANDRQVGGAHYKTNTGLQHWDLVAEFGLDYFDGNTSKYLSRGHMKNGRQDYAKAVHYIDKRNELGYAPFMMSQEQKDVLWEFCQAQGMPLMAARALFALLEGRRSDAREAAEWLSQNFT